MKAKRAMTALERLAGEAGTAPRDIDPEALQSNGSTENSERDSEEDGVAGREHYAPVGKSKLRDHEIASLGPQYTGSKISRLAIEDDDSDDPFAKGFDEASDLASGNEEDDGSLVSSAGEVDINGSAASGSTSGAPSENGYAHSDVSTDEASDASPRTTTAAVDDGSRDQVRSLLARSQTAVAANVARATAAEAAKGRAVASQRRTFDALLGARIRLQQGLVATNSLPFGLVAANDDDDRIHELPDAVAGAETAATTLLTTLASLRAASLSGDTEPKPITVLQKRTYDQYTSSRTIARDLRSADDAARSRNTDSLAKWATKTRPATSANPRRTTLINADEADSQLTTSLAAQLADPGRLIERARTPRSCAPLQVARSADDDGRRRKRGPNDDEEDENNEQRDTIAAAEKTIGPLYDDADFYARLLADLVARRASDPAGGGANGESIATVDVASAARGAACSRHRPGVDVRASKGRRLKYAPHERLVDFMAPEERGVWPESRRREFFAGVLGGKMALVEIEDEDEDEDMIGGDVGALKLFGR